MRLRCCDGVVVVLLWRWLCRGALCNGGEIIVVEIRSFGSGGGGGEAPRYM